MGRFIGLASTACRYAACLSSLRKRLLTDSETLLSTALPDWNATMKANDAATPTPSQSTDCNQHCKRRNGGRVDRVLYFFSLNTSICPKFGGIRHDTSRECFGSRKFFERYVTAEHGHADSDRQFRAHRLRSSSCNRESRPCPKHPEHRTDHSRYCTRGTASDAIGTPTIRPVITGRSN